MKIQRKGYLIVILLAFFWLVGFIGNRFEWVRKNCHSVKSSYRSARTNTARDWRIQKDRRAQEEASAKMAEEASRQKREMVEAQRQASEQKEKALREFALKESPVLWRSVVQMRRDIAEQDRRIGELAQALRMMGNDPEADMDYQKFVEQRVRLQASLDGVLEKVKEAYIASCKFATAMGRKERAAFEEHATKEGAVEAEATSSRYNNMRLNK